MYAYKKRGIDTRRHGNPFLEGDEDICSPGEGDVVIPAGEQAFDPFDDFQRQCLFLQMCGFDRGAGISSAMTGVEEDKRP